MLKSLLSAFFALAASFVFAHSTPCPGDTEPPQISCSAPPTVFLNASNLAYLPIADVASGTDDCAIVSWAYSFDNQIFTASEAIPFNCFHANSNAPNAVWVRAADETGNVSTACFVQIWVLETTEKYINNYIQKRIYCCCQR